MDEDKRLFVAAQLLPSLILDREKERNYTRERAVEIVIEYTDLLISKLNNSPQPLVDDTTPAEIAKEELAKIVQTVQKNIDKRFLIIERTDDGKLRRQGRLNSNGTVEWTRVYS